MLQSNSMLVATTLAAAAIVSAMIWRYRKKQTVKRFSPKDMEIPSEWTKIGEVGEVVVYPLKGARKQCVSEAAVTEVGLHLAEEFGKLALQDRMFVVFDDKNQFLSIKDNSKILFVETDALDKQTVKFSFPNSEQLVLGIPNSRNILDHVEIKFGERVTTVDCGERAAEWFSERLLGKASGLRLGCFVQSLVPPRTIDGCYDAHAKVYTKMHSDYMGMYHNLASYLLVSEASIDDLNSRIDRSPVNAHYFRPNIVVKGSSAFSEDDWDWIKIGDTVILRGFKYCIRCSITTIDPDTGVRDPKAEPLKTLRSYRQIKDPLLRTVDGSDPVMGMYAGCHRTGIVKVGDPIYVQINKK